MTDHQLRLTGHPVYDWELECTHDSGAPGWRTCDEAGEYVSDECWLRSWWDELGMEMVTDDDRHGPWPTPTGPSIPVAVLDGTQDEPLLVPAPRRPRGRIRLVARRRTVRP